MPTPELPSRITWIVDVDIDILDAPITIIRAYCENLFAIPPTLSLGLESGRGRQLLPAAGGSVNIYRGTGDTAGGHLQQVWPPPPLPSQLQSISVNVN